MQQKSILMERSGYRLYQVNRDDGRIHYEVHHAAKLIGAFSTLEKAENCFEEYEHRISTHD